MQLHGTIPSASQPPELRDQPGPIAPQWVWEPPTESEHIAMTHPVHWQLGGNTGGRGSDGGGGDGWGGSAGGRGSGGEGGGGDG